MKKSIPRRRFLTHAPAALAAPALLASGCTAEPLKAHAEAPYLNFNETYRWKMITTWPPNFPILGEGCNKFAQWVNEMSGGRLEITVYGGGELVPSLEVFDAVSNGAVELGHGAAYYWAGKIPAAQFFSTVPFGMNAQQMNAWLISGDGGALWRDTYAPFDLLPFPGGNTGMQMGGWFNREIKSNEDINGLKMRIPGIGGKVFARAGGTAVLSAGGEIYTNLERGVIDATEWIGPYHDYQMGFYQVAKYYYYPGWHEPGTALELFVNRSRYEALPTDLQAIVRAAAARLNSWSFAESEKLNSIYAKKLADEEGVQYRRFPEPVLSTFKQYTEEILDDMVTGDPISQRIYDNYREFQQSVGQYATYNERIYYGDRNFGEFA